MAHQSGEGGNQISRGRFLRLHADPTVIGPIHPDLLHQALVRSSPREAVPGRTIQLPGTRTLSSTWKMTSDPPETFRWEIIGDDRPMEEGPWVASGSIAAPGGIHLAPDKGGDLPPEGPAPPPEGRGPTRTELDRHARPRPSPSPSVA